MRDHILSEIKRLAAKNGEPPGQTLFANETGIRSHEWRGKFWARWGDALLDAGLQPNEWTGRLDSNGLLAGFVVACRHFGRLPTRDELSMHRQSDSSVPSYQSILRHFGQRDGLIVALKKYADENADLDDIAAMLPEVVTRPAEALTRQTLREKVGFIFGNRAIFIRSVGATTWNAE